MLTPHNPVFVKPTLENLETFHGEAVVVKFTDSEQTSGEPILYCLMALKGEGDEVLLKWAYISQSVPISQIAGIAPRHCDTIEELKERQSERRSEAIVKDIKDAREYRQRIDTDLQSPLDIKESD